MRIDSNEKNARRRQNSYWLHMRPRWYPKSVTRFTYTFSLGWFSVFLAVILGSTGCLLMIFYTPSVDAAYSSTASLIFTVPFGNLVRNLHSLAGDLMVVVVMLHMLRVYFTAAYKRPRQMNWVVGVCLLLITFLFSYSGYLLPWDQRAYWAATIGTGLADSIPLIGPKIRLFLLGGSQVGQASLLRFFALHVAILPLTLIVLFGVHYYKVVRQGISRPPSLSAGKDKRENEKQIPFIPDILARDLMCGTLALLFLIIVALTIYDAPLNAPADPYLTPLQETAPWFFLWVQGLIKLPDLFGGLVEGRFVYGILLPGAFFVFLVALPVLDRNPHRPWQQRKTAVTVGLLAALLWATLTWMGTPAFKVEIPAAEAIMLKYVPWNRAGEIHQLGWDDLPDGTWSTGTIVNESKSLDGFMSKLQASVDAQADQLPHGVAILTITNWQKKLKQIELTLTWGDGGEHHSVQTIYIHQDSAGR